MSEHSILKLSFNQVRNNSSRQGHQKQSYDLQHELQFLEMLYFSLFFRKYGSKKFKILGQFAIMHVDVSKVFHLHLNK